MPHGCAPSLSLVAAGMGRGGWMPDRQIGRGGGGSEQWLMFYLQAESDVYGYEAAPCGDVGLYAGTVGEVWPTITPSSSELMMNLFNRLGMGDLEKNTWRNCTTADDGCVQIQMRGRAQHNPKATPRTTQECNSGRENPTPPRHSKKSTARGGTAPERNRTARAKRDITMRPLVQPATFSCHSTADGQLPRSEIRNLTTYIILVPLAAKGGAPHAARGAKGDNPGSGDKVSGE